MAVRITKYLYKYVRRGICLIYISRFSYQVEALINVFRYHTCRSIHPEDRKLPITELKWDARTVTDIPGISGALSLPEKYEKPICGITRNIRQGLGIPF
jgi:hypothetical protein